ncbi:MAG: signal recognition particle subunit SRP19/SEC65 family protein [Thermoplasmata archaeon]
MPDYFYIYPAYLTEGLSRRGGRRVLGTAAIKDVTLEEIVAASKHLGCPAEAEANKQYPRQYFTWVGRVKVTKKEKVKKAEFLRRVAEEIRRVRPRTEAAHGGGHA